MKNYVAFELEVVYCSLDVITASNPDATIKDKDNFGVETEGTFY